MIVVIGAGPAGIAAALRAYECGAEVLVIDDNPAPGGQIWRGAHAGNAWIRRFHAARIPVLPNSRVIAGTARLLTVETPDGHREIACRRLILATGSRELFLPFPGWTLPGVMGAGGLQALAKSGMNVTGKRIVVAGTGPLLLAVAAFLRRSGARVSLIAEQAPLAALTPFARELLRSPSKLLQGAALAWHIAGVPYMRDCWVEAAHGHQRLESIALRTPHGPIAEECDYAAIGYGLVPNDELSSLLGIPACTHAGGVDLAIVEGEIAGYEAADRPDKALALEPRRARARRFARAIDQSFALRPELKHLCAPDTFVCRCEDVPYSQLLPFHSFRAAKLHTRCGMGPCQARICSPAAAFLFGWPAEPAARPPAYPARIGSLLPVIKT